MKKKNSFLYKTLIFMAFAGPAAFCFLLVLVIPFLYGLYLTLTSWNGIAVSKTFVGLENYMAALADSAFWQSVQLTILYTAISVILLNLLAFALACLATSGIKGQSFFRAGFFTPNLIGGLVLGYIWQFVFSRALVFAGKQLGVELFATSWLSNPTTALAALVVVTVWQYSGFMMLIYIAGLMGIPTELKEAATMDGCNSWQALRFITLPQMSSSFVICLFLSITRCFMAYDLNLSLTDGGPFGSTRMASMYVYHQAFVSKDYGMGQTQAVILFLICIIISLVQVFVGSKSEVDA